MITVRGRVAVASAHVAFFLTGVVTTLLGPVLPLLASRWSLPDAAAGTLFTAQFVGSLAGTAMSGLLVRRAGFRRALLSGLGLIVGGTVCLPITTWPAALLAVACYGVGLGITIPSTNLFVADAFADQRSEALNILNLAWAAGAVAGPAVFARLWGLGVPDAFLFGIAAAAGAVMIVIAALVQDHAPIGASPASTPSGGGWSWTALFPFAALFFLYVGTENALAGWVAAYARRIEASQLAASMPMVFWGALLIGRGAAPPLLRRFEETPLVLCGLGLSVAGTAALLAAPNVTGVAMGAAIAGLGLAAVFPTTIAQLSRELGDAAPRAASVAFLCAALGGATVPWLVGAWSTSAGNLRWGFVVPLAGSLLMMALHAWRPRPGR